MNVCYVILQIQVLFLQYSSVLFRHRRYVVTTIPPPPPLPLHHHHHTITVTTTITITITAPAPPQSPPLRSIIVNQPATSTIICCTCSWLIAIHVCQNCYFNAKYYSSTNVFYTCISINMKPNVLFLHCPKPDVSMRHGKHFRSRSDCRLSPVSGTSPSQQLQIPVPQRRMGAVWNCRSPDPEPTIYTP